MSWCCGEAVVGGQCGRSRGWVKGPFASKAREVGSGFMGALTPRLGVK